MALLEDSLIAHYKLNDNLATDVILDETGSHNGAVKDAGGTATSAFHSVAGKIRKAQEFDGVDDHIEIPDHNDFTPALTPFSISAWVNMDDASNFPIANKGQYNVDGEWYFVVEDNDRIVLRVYDESVPSCRLGRFVSGQLTAYENQWIHLIGTYDGGVLSAGLKIYLNGIRVDTTTHETNSGSFVSIENLGGNVTIGKSVALYLNGTIDNVMFFNKELTALEVQLLYNSGAGVETIPTGINLSRTGQQFSSSPMN